MATISIAIMKRSSHVIYSIHSPPFVSATKEGKRYFGFLDETPSKQPPLTKSDMTEADTPLREPKDSTLNYSTNAFQSQGFFICLTTKKSCFFLFRITKNS